MQAPDAEIISACLMQMRSLGFGEGGEHSHITALGGTPKAVHIQPQTPALSLWSTHCGCSLYKVPSTPTVILMCSSPWSSLLFSTMAARPAP